VRGAIVWTPLEPGRDLVTPGRYNKPGLSSECALGGIVRAFLLGCLGLAQLLPSAPAAVDPAPLPKEIRVSKTVFVSNQGIEPGTMDVVYDELRKWSHWTLVDEADKADLIIVLSARSYFAGMAYFGSASATASATTYGNTTTAQASSTSQGASIPIFQQTRFLTVVEPRSRAGLLTLSCRRREINGDSRTGKTLVNELKGRFPKDQR
jgi:hypothetical protein